jgi:uncharacterized ion transporter superfamily protein YfcC
MKKTPDALIIVAVILVLVIASTWVIPAGSFDRIEKDLGDRTVTVVVPGTYQPQEASPQSIFTAFTAPLKGITSAANIIAFVLLVGGAFSMLMKTGAIDAALHKILERAKKHPGNSLAVIPLLMLVFAFAGYSFGMSEETLVFVLITLPLARSLGYDNFVGVAIPFIGAGVGFAGAAFNPFTVGIAHGIAELPVFSGAGYRTLICVVFTLVASVWVMRYARKVMRNPELRFLPEGQGSAKALDAAPFTTPRRIILLLFFAALAMVMYGAVELGWYIGEISGLFIALGIASVVIARMSVGDSVKAFYEGAKDMLPAGLIIGLSKSILVVAEDGMIIDTILHALSGAADGLPKVVAVQMMFFVQGAINFFIPSGSGQAAITIPIMSPLADLLGISRQTAVLAYQFGDGLFNLIIPTSGVTMGILSIAGIPFGKWLRWVWKLIVLLVILSMVFLALPVAVFEWM